VTRDASGYPRGMTTGQIVAIVVLVLLVALVVAAVLFFRRKSPDVRRAEAAQHRQEAEQRRASAERLEAEAAERAMRARAEQEQAQKLAEMAAHDRQVAEKAAAEAARLDPEYHPGDDRPAVTAAERPAATARPEEPAHRDRRAEFEQEPIVGGAAEGMITPRRNRHHADDGLDDTVPTPVDERPVPARRPAPEQETRPNRTVGDAVREREGADRGATATGERPTLADRIMGRA
jgi:FtsZ-interacting cell division protein ZipA